MVFDVVAGETVALWPAGAPGAMDAGLEDCPRLTPYLPRGTAGRTAAVVVCPGGGYGMRAAHEGEPVARWLAGLGVAGCVLDYRVKPYRHPAPLHDAQRALRMVRARAGDWNIDPLAVGILGFSAGGHLATSAATIFDTGEAQASDPVDRQSCRPDALIACYPVVSMGEFRHHGSMVALLGEEASPALREAMSLENRVTPQTPPAFIWHTSDDPSVPVENALLLAGALRRARVAFDLHVFAHGRHGLGLAKDDPQVGLWTGLCEKWLGRIGFLRRV